MPEIYADWKLLEPLTELVPAGTKCVVIRRITGDKFQNGEIVTTIDGLDAPNCKNSDGIFDFLRISRLALLPADYQAEPKAEQPAPAKPERKVVQIATLLDGIVCLCNDGTVLTRFPSDNKWSKLPPIPQD